MTGISSLNGEQTYPWLPTGPALLFAPADRPERFAKAAERSDMVIIDLEDGAAVDNHAQARENIMANPLDPATTILRITGPEAPTFSEDVAFARKCNYDIIMVPKIRESIPAELEGLKIIAMIETPQAMINIQQIATHPGVVGLFWGAEDLTAELGGVSSRLSVDENPRRHYRDPQRLARALVQVHAAAAGIAAIDAIHADFRDERGQYLEALDAVGCGFLATACIHPAMVPPVRKAYRPSEATLTRARKIVDNAGTHTGAFQLDGEMIDAPVVKQAVAALARAGITE
ncbi:MAG: CoA ester lyase [Corynebacterium sp.]|uniref:HpcH/HpaI aldolase/citrate lyase family protein n=1 Tax=Corynebacterium sp. TaxID=1720 RepID=UPI0026DD79FC|nr:CoA ester lyase [Corynebacterium sp.]MDO5030175.1 CoA ester lyase [Corynebacterium sp.]